MKRTTTRNYDFRDEEPDPFLVGTRNGSVIISHEMGLNIELTIDQAKTLAIDILDRITKHGDVTAWQTSTKEDFSKLRVSL